ncbi:protein of unknown function [Nitrospina watsonii]|uniref:Uncharacterized protein n=1 Tax=Nitrospina watsonii TaxID=1323948 RepID=A0ABM9HBF0_9BACT|nr:protein of unknown function [Nitrospina watsonii]
MGRRFEPFAAHSISPNTTETGRPHRLARPRTPAFHAGDGGSNPPGDAKFSFPLYQTLSQHSTYKHCLLLVRPNVNLERAFSLLI